MEKEKYVKTCPKCDSKEVTQLAGLSQLQDNRYTCLTCGFSGPLFPEVSQADAEKLPDKQRNFTPSNAPVFPVEHANKELKFYYKLFIAIFLIGIGIATALAIFYV